jgi:hypothetical protein
MTAQPALTLASLAHHPIWVGWKEEMRADKNGKPRPTKVPYDPKTGKMAKSDNPRTWAACELAQAWTIRAAADGIGLMFDLVGDMLVCGIDLDTCRDPITGVIESWAQVVIDRFATYSEVSPSKTGVKLFFTISHVDLATVEALFGGANKYGRMFKRANGSDHPPAIEIHRGHRYFTVTKDALNGVDAFTLISVDDLKWLIDHGQKFAGQGAARAGASAESSDKSRSAKAFREGARLKREGASYEEMRDALLGHTDPDILTWLNEKGLPNGERELHKIYDKTRNPQQLPPWLQTCEKDGRGRLIPNLANLMITLRFDPDLVDAFAFDQMLHAPVLRKELPAAPNGRTTNGTDPLPRPLRDADVSDLREYVQHNGFPRIANDVSHEAINKRARELSFHPIRQWLSGLVWDGTPRLEGWLGTYLGAAGEPKYLAAIGAMFLIAMVARVYRPGCKVDYMLVLEGDQGVAKSQACAILAGEWFSDALPDIRHKDASLHHRGKWLIEISELSTFTRADIEVLKAFITRDTERYRPPYGRLEVVEPRQSMFVGTTNRSTYLKDETGGRRFWPFLVGVIDLIALRRDRGQLFAEALMRFHRGDHWWPSAAFEAETIRSEQEKRREEDPWEGPIAEYIDGKALGVSSIKQVSITEIARLALGFDVIAKVNTTDQRRITAVLKTLHWKPGGRDKHARYYIPE